MRWGLHTRVLLQRIAPRLIINQIGDKDFFQRGNNTPIRQMLIFLEHLVEERRRSQNSDALIIDRTLVDHLSYTSVLFPEIETSSEFRVCKNIAFESLFCQENMTCYSSYLSSFQSLAMVLEKQTQSFKKK